MNEIPPSRSQDIRDLLGDQAVDDLIAEFGGGVPEPGSTAFADGRNRNIIANDLAESSGVTMPALGRELDQTPTVDLRKDAIADRTELDASLGAIEAMEIEDPDFDLSDPNEAAKLRESSTTVGTTPDSMEIVRGVVPNHLDRDARQAELAQQFNQVEQQQSPIAS